MRLLGAYALFKDALSEGILAGAAIQRLAPRRPRAYIPPMIGGLYNTDILTLASALRHETLAAPCASVRKVSKLCGSELELDLQMEGGLVSACAVRVQACALGQASAAILNAHIIGASVAEIKAARDGLEAMLKDKAPAPAGRFAQLELLAGVAGYPARHQSTLLAFEAALSAAQDCAAK